MTNTTVAGAPSLVLYRFYSHINDQFKYELVMRLSEKKYASTFTINGEAYYSMTSGVQKYLMNDIKHSLCKGMSNFVPWIDFGWLMENFPGDTTDPAVKNIKAEGPLADWEKELLGYKGPSNLYSVADEVAFADDPVQKKAEKLPGMDFLTTSPCACSYAFGKQNGKELTGHEPKIVHRIMDIIIHLNDKHAHDFDDEKIYKWLDDLHDSGVVDLSIEIPDKEITK